MSEKIKNSLFKEKITFIKVLILFLKESFSDLKKNQKKVDILLCLGDGDYNNKIHNKIFSPLIDNLNQDFISLGYKSGVIKSYDSLIPEKNLYNKTLPYRLRFWFYYIIAKIKGFSAAERHLYSWGRIINYINPRLIIGIQPNLYLCEIAKKLEIPIFDFQHAIIDPNNEYYKNFFKLITKNSLPFKLLSSFSYTIPNLKIQGLSTKNVSYIGSPLLADNYFYKRNLSKIKNKKTFVILFTHSGKNYDSYFSKVNNEKNIWTDSGLPINLLKSLSEIKTPIKLIIRLHPNYKLTIELKKEIMQYSKKGACDIEISNDNSLIYDLYRSDLHFTHQSAVLCEASEIGLDTICLSKDKNLKKWVGAQLKDKNIKIINNDVDLIKKIIIYYLKIKKNRKISRNKYRFKYLNRLDKFVKKELELFSK